MTDVLELRRTAAELKESPFPPQVIVETVSRCNLDCAMCPQSALTRPRGVMSLDLVRKIVDEVADYAPPKTKVWPAVMGEPLMARDRLWDMLSYAQQRGVAIHLNTNANLLGAEDIERIRGYGVREVIVGMDADTPETYVQVRRKGDFAKTVANVEALLKACRQSGPRVILQFIDVGINAHEIDSFKQRWLEKGAVVKTRVAQAWGHWDHLLPAEHLVIPFEERFMACPWLFRNLVVLWDGRVTQCDGDMDCNYPAGDINQQSLRDVWLGELKRRRDRQMKLDFTDGPCKGCRDWQVGLSKFWYPDEPDRYYAVDVRQA
jgi:radical SAM protein with 4Fe4S-binding SPASM domain